MNFVSAENNTTIDDNSIKDNNIGTAGSNNQINNNSFNELNNMINGDLNKTEVILDKDYVYQYDYDVNFTEGIFINRSLTIDGQGHTIDAKFKSRIFLINSSKVILKNIIFINGAGMSSGALHFDNNSVGYIINSTFINNLAVDGGAIGQYENSTLTIVNSSFIKNKGNNGAAIYCHNSSNTIQNSLFINNIVSGMSNGGAISYVWHSNCSIMNSTFINNSAIMYGGALFFSKYCKGVIVNSTFINNNAETGGAIKFFDGGSNIVNSIFNHNSASKKGGAIYFTKGSKNYINNSSFINNSAEKGGGIFYFDKTKGIVNNSIFIENTAKYGGGIYYLNESSKSIVINSVFIRNYAENTCAMNCQNARNCTIIRINPILTANTITSFYNTAKYLTITLKNHKYSPINNTSISISINNVVKILKTDSKGQINIPTKNLIPNSYNVLISFNGSDKYENKTIKGSVKNLTDSLIFI